MNDENLIDRCDRAAMEFAAADTRRVFAGLANELRATRGRSGHADVCRRARRALKEYGA